jgi:hypothetical protein
MDFSFSLKILFGVLQIDPVFLEKCVDFEACLKPKHAPYLGSYESAGTVTFQSQSLQGVLRQITPLRFEALDDIFG